MKREGHQHGSVRTQTTPPYTTTSINQKKQQQMINSPPTAGIFTRVTTKPTNHSKFTGKCEQARCRGCHLHPAWRSKDKIKGTHKLKSSNMALDYGGFMAWRVNIGNDQARPRKSNKLKLDGYSASRILDELTSSDCYYYSHLDYANEEDDDDYDHDGESVINYDYGDGDNWVNDESARIGLMGTNVIPMSISYDGDGCDRIELVLDDNDDTTSTSNDDDDDDMEFFDVAIVWEPIDCDEGWSIVGEM